MSNRYSLSQTCNPRPADVPPTHPHQQPRWQDRYAVAIARGTSARRLLDVLNRRDAF